jgi:hypothetical protein
MYNVGTRNFKIVSIEFELDSITYNTNLDYAFSIYIVNNEISYIETVEDLLNMVGDSRIYVLNNDIDFAGVNWTPINFNGVLIGNGFKFNNLSIIDFSSNERSLYSIFNTVNGVISDLNIKDVFISIDKNSHVQASGLVISNHGVINNVSVSGIIEIAGDEVNIAGIVAFNHGLIINSFTEISILNSSKSAYIGGVSAWNFQNGTIRNTRAISTINTSSLITFSMHTVGGLLGQNEGRVYETSADTILNVRSSFIFTGGLIGYNSGTVVNSLSKGIANSVKQPGDSWVYSSGFVGFNSQSGMITSSYSSVSTNINNSNLEWSSSFVGENQGSVKKSFSSGTGFKQSFIDLQSGVFVNNFTIEEESVITIEGLIYKATIDQIVLEISAIWDLDVWDFTVIDNVAETHPRLRD